MIASLGGHDFNTCAALGVMLCHLVSYCDQYRLPLNIIDADENSFSFSTDGWTEQLTFKYQYHVKKDYDELKKPYHNICTLLENTVLIVVNEHASVANFRRG